MIEPDHDDAGLDREMDRVAGFLAEQLELSSLGKPLALTRVQMAVAAEHREAARVAAIIAKDQDYSRREAERNAAIIQVADGLTVNIGNTVVEPTPEWLSKGENRTVGVGGDRWTDKPVSTVRRMFHTHPQRLYNAGKFTEAQMKACLWYRETYELSGLNGNIKSSSFAPRITGGLHGGVIFTSSQSEAQDHLRNASLLIPFKIRKFFDLVVLLDKGLKQAADQSYRSPHYLDALRCAADRVSDYVEYIVKPTEMTDQLEGL